MTRSLVYVSYHVSLLMNAGSYTVRNITEVDFVRWLRRCTSTNGLLLFIKDRSVGCDAQDLRFDWKKFVGKRVQAR
jgi:hypothetical protein